MRYIQLQDLNDLEGIIVSIEALLKRVNNRELSNEVQEVLAIASDQLNNSLFMSVNLDWDCVIPDYDEMYANDRSKQIEAMLPVWKLSLERRRGLQIDSEFWSLYEYFKYVNRDAIISNAMAIFQSYTENYQRQFTSLPQRYTFLTGKLDIEQNDYSLIPIYVDMMKAEVENFKWLYNKLADYRSKQVLIRIVRFWFTFDLNDLGDLHENIFKDYFDLDLLSCDENEIMVDCGAYVGDSVLDYIHTWGGRYRKIYAYEISPDTMNQMQQNLEKYENIIFRQKAVGSMQAKMYLDEETEGAGARITQTGKICVEVVPLDEDIEEPVSIIKMDIEGAERDALIGAQRHIVQDRPRLLVCTYHKPEDLFQIPRLIESMRDDYAYYLRFNGRGIWPCDHVLFAV